MPEEIRISDFMFSPDAEPPAEPAPEEVLRLGESVREFQEKVTNAERNWREIMRAQRGPAVASLISMMVDTTQLPPRGLSWTYLEEGAAPATDETLLETGRREVLQSYAPDPMWAERFRNGFPFRQRIEDAFVDDARVCAELATVLRDFENYPMKGLSTQFIEAILPSILIDTVHGGLSYCPVHNIIVTENSEDSRRNVPIGWQAEAFLLSSVLSRVYQNCVSNDIGTAARISRGQNIPVVMERQIIHIVKSLVAMQRFQGFRHNLLFGETTVRHGVNQQDEGGMKFQVKFADAADLL